MPSSRADNLRILTGIILALSYIAVAARLYIQGRKTKAFGADDCFLVASLCSFTLYIISILLSLRTGIGAHISPSTSPIALRFWLIGEITYILTSTLLRTAVLIHLRKFATLPRQRQIIFLLMSGMVTYNVGFLLVLMFENAPVQFVWAGWKDEANWTTGIEQDFMAQLSYGFAGVATVTDWALVLIAPCLYWEFDLSVRTKHCLRVLLIMGIGAGAAALVRIPTTTKLLTTDDFFFDCVPIAIGSTVEIGLGMIALSATSYRYLFPVYFARPVPDPVLPVMVSEKQGDSDAGSNSSHEASTCATSPIHPARNSSSRSDSSGSSSSIPTWKPSHGSSTSITSLSITALCTANTGAQVQREDAGKGMLRKVSEEQRKAAMGVSPVAHRY